MALVHQHLLISATVKKPIKDLTRGINWLMGLVNILGMQPFALPTGGYSTVKGNRGLTLLVPITTSSITCHFWDEEKPARMELDVYSCKEFNPKTVFNYLNKLKPLTIEYKFLDRTYNFVEIQGE